MLLATRATKVSAQTPSLRLHAVDRAAETGRNGSVARSVSKMDEICAADIVMRQVRQAWILFEFCASAMSAALSCATKIGCILHLRSRLGFF